MKTKTQITQYVLPVWKAWITVLKYPVSLFPSNNYSTGYMSIYNCTLLVLRKCGHVICNKCIDSFVKKSQTCYVCEHKTKEKDIIDMSAEGTGFASNSSMLEAKKFDVAFQ